MAKHSVRNFSSAAKAVAVKVDVLLEHEELNELDVEYGSESPTPSQMAAHYSAGWASATQGDLGGTQIHLSWLAGCFADLDKKFRAAQGGRICELYSWEIRELAGEQKELYQTAQLAVEYTRTVAKEAGLHYWPGMLVPHQSLAAMLRAEQLRLQWLKCEPWTEKKKGGGWDSAGYYGWDASRVLSMFRRAGCKLGPRFDRLLRLHHEGLPTNCMKSSFSEVKQLAIARGVYFANLASGRHSNQALAALGRLDPRVAIVAAVYDERRCLLGLSYNAPARARHLDWDGVVRATKLWRQIDAHEEYSHEDVLWYATYTGDIVDQCKFVFRASKTMLIRGVTVDGKTLLARRGNISLKTLMLTDAEGRLGAHYVYTAYADGKIFYTIWYNGVLRLLPVIHPGGYNLLVEDAVEEYLR